MKDNSEIWEEICFILSDSISPTISESIFEQKVILALDKLGWSQFKNDIITQTSLHIGRQNSIRPDIILCGPDQKPLVAIEIKRPAEKLASIDQLKSYMRQLKADFGLLIGSEIRIYYDGRMNPYSEPLPLERIYFERLSVKGQKFVELFSKSDFLEKRYVSYLEKKISQFNMKLEIKKLKKDICSKITEDKIFEFLKSEYSESGKNIISEVIKDLKIKLYFEDTALIHPAIKQIPSKTIVELPSNTIVEEDTKYVKVCKNKSNGKLFAYLESADNGPNYVVNQEGKHIEYDPKLYDDPEERKINTLLENNLITEHQLKKYNSYIKEMGTFKIGKPATYGKASSPSAFDWSSKIPELSKHGFNSWKKICEFLNLDVGADSGRRKLKKWVKKNKPHWPKVPDA